jgi:hypothetical protein
MSVRSYLAHPSPYLGWVTEAYAPLYTAPTNGMRCLLILLGMLLMEGVAAQEQTRPKGIFFPTPMYERNWHASLGFVTMATPEALTEEFQHRIPALDLQLMRQIHGGLHFSVRAWSQILQNHLSLGLRWATPLNERWNLGLGGDAAVWKGTLIVENFNTDAVGWAAYPNASLGYKAGRNVLVTFKTEAIVKLDYQVRVGSHEITREVAPFNGMAWSLYVEQPFFGKTHLALGFTARYTSFFWATWALFNTYERPLLYRHITIAFIP